MTMCSADGRLRLGPALEAMVADFDGAFVVAVVDVTTTGTVDGDAVDFEYFLIAVVVDCRWAN